MQLIIFKFYNQSASFDRQKAWKTITKLSPLSHSGRVSTSNQKFSYSHQVVIDIYHRYKASSWMDKSHWSTGIPENKSHLQSLSKFCLHVPNASSGLQNWWMHEMNPVDWEKVVGVCKKPQPHHLLILMFRLNQQVLQVRPLNDSTARLLTPKG